jgi:hypothetical protein
MEKLVLRGTKEDIRLIADLAVRLGMTTKYVNNEDLHTTLSADQGQDSTDAGMEDENENVIREFREKFE